MSRDPLILGIRHHGPGSSRSMMAALDAAQPDTVLIEGPDEANELIPYLLYSTPPVAMLFYNVEQPSSAVFYPFATFSPEYLAIKWAAAHQKPVRFIDLPMRHRLAFEVTDRNDSSVLDDIATAGGYEDFEDWWEHLVERRVETSDLFKSLESLIAELRPPAELAQPEGEVGAEITSAEYEQLREDWMRREIRKAGSNAAVICGAWHGPALRQKPRPKRKLPSVKISSTLAPWSYDRLTSFSGYGAGAPSPAYFELAWNSTSDSLARNWMVRAAQLIRGEGIESSSASVIEAVRLAEALAALRNRPRPGLRELREAAWSVLIVDEAIGRLIGKYLVVGMRVGDVPEDTPAVPLLADLRAQQKRLRLKVEDAVRTIDLDLRKENDLEKSHLLHRLQLLKIPWGSPQRATGKHGTFHELWEVVWTPELTIATVEASKFGNTVESAGTASAIQRASESQELAEITRLVDKVLAGNLISAIEPVIQRLRDVSATAADVGDLANALPPLVAAIRYGGVRSLDVERLQSISDTLFIRFCLGIPIASQGIDEEAAQKVVGYIEKVNSVVALVDSDEYRQRWTLTLANLANTLGVHPFIAGRTERLRYDLGAISAEELAIRMSQEASSGAKSLDTAAFVEGILTGSGTVLIHEQKLFGAIDDWIMQLPEETFDDILPLIRRTFSEFSRSERRMLWERVRGSDTSAAKPAREPDQERAQRVLPVLKRILGV